MLYTHGCRLLSRCRRLTHRLKSRGPRHRKKKKRYPYIYINSTGFTSNVIDVINWKLFDIVKQWYTVRRALMAWTVVSPLCFLLYFICLSSRIGILLWKKTDKNDNETRHFTDQVIIIIISTTMFMVLSSWQSHCESSPGSFDECRMAPSGRRPKAKPDDLGCESACTGCQKLHPPSPFIITQPESWYSFYRPTKGRRLSRPSWLVTYRDGLPVHMQQLTMV